MQIYSFDIETAPLDIETIQDRSKPFFAVPFIDEPFKKGRLSKPESVAKAKAEYEHPSALLLRQSAHADAEDLREDEHVAKLVRGATLKSHHGYICCISMAGPDGTRVEMITDPADEKRLIQMFGQWYRTHASAAGNCVIAGYNIKSFDVPWLVRRGIVHGLDLNLINKRNQMNVPLWDLAETWNACWSSTPVISLDNLARTLGITGKPNNGVTGADFWKQLASGKLEECRLYAARDAEIVVDIARHFIAAGQYPTY